MKLRITRVINILAIIVLFYALFVINCTSNAGTRKLPTFQANGSAGNQVYFSYTNNYRVIESTSIPRNFENTFPNQGNPNSPTNQNIKVRLTLNPTKNPSLVMGSSTTLGSNYTETGIKSMNNARNSSGIPALLKIGIAVDGVLIEPGTAEVWNEGKKARGQVFQVENPQWSYDGLGPSRTGDFVGMDTYKGHVQPSGLYHYHSITSNTGLFEEDPEEHSRIVAFAADGIPIYGPYGYDESGRMIKKMYGNYKLKLGERVAVKGQNPGGSYDGTFIQDYVFAEGKGDVDALESGTQISILDEANGHVGKVPAEEIELYKFSAEYTGKKYVDDNTYTMYHYHVTQNFPYSPRKLYGVVDESFSMVDKPQGGPPDNMPPPPRQ